VKQYVPAKIRIIFETEKKKAGNFGNPYQIAQTLYFILRFPLAV
jgi:hypothetical protein